MYFKMQYEWGQLSPRINTHLFKSVDPVKKLVMLKLAEIDRTIHDMVYAVNP